MIDTHLPQPPRAIAAVMQKIFEQCSPGCTLEWRFMDENAPRRYPLVVRGTESLSISWNEVWAVCAGCANVGSTEHGLLTITTKPSKA